MIQAKVAIMRKAAFMRKPHIRLCAADLARIAALGMTLASVSPHAAQAATASTAPTPAIALQSLKGVPIHHLAADAGQLRFEGESVNRAWPMYVTPAESKSRARFRLAYTNAVSVNPELSSITVSINDVVIAQEKIMAPGDPAMIDAEVPEGLLVTGYNAVRITANQRHRVDCSISAT